MSTPRTGFELTNVAVISTDCTGSCIFNYHTITTMTKYNRLNINMLNYCILNSGDKFVYFYFYQILTAFNKLKIILEVAHERSKVT
jgi:hypothetical protein